MGSYGSGSEPEARTQDSGLWWEDDLTVEVDIRISLDGYLWTLGMRIEHEDDKK